MSDVKRRFNITLDQSCLGDANKMECVIGEIEKATGEKTEGSARMRKYGIVSALADDATKGRLAQLPGVMAIEEDETKHLS